MFSRDFLIEEAKDELNKIIEMENKLNRDDFIYKTGSKKTYNFQKFKRNLLEEKFIIMIYH